MYKLKLPHILYENNELEDLQDRELDFLHHNFQTNSCINPDDKRLKKLWMYICASSQLGHYFSLLIGILNQ